MHYYKFNISDWGLSTAHLSLEEEAIYFRLINHYYDTQLPIPLDTAQVFRRLRLSQSEDIAIQILQEFFTETKKGWTHKKCEKILKEYIKNADKNKVNGAKGGRPRKEAGSGVSEHKPSGLSLGTQTEPNHNPNYEPRTKNQELRTKEKILDEEFDNVWSLYGKKGNRKTSKAKYTKLPEATRLTILNHIPIYNLSTPDKQYRKNFETYLNQEVWNDEVTTHEANQPRQNPAGHKLSAVERVRAAGEERERQRQAGACNGQVMDAPIRDIRTSASQPVRGNDTGELGAIIEGDYTRSN